MSDTFYEDRRRLYTDSEVHETLAKRIRAGWTVESVVFRFARRVEDTRRRKRRVRR